MSCEVVLGGIYGYVEVFANNHRTRCHISPVCSAETFNPRASQYADIYTVEKISTKEGWTALPADENHALGYQQELQDFLGCMAHGGTPQSGLELALDTTTAIYAGYLSNEREGAAVEIPLL